MIRTRGASSCWSAACGYGWSALVPWWQVFSSSRWRGLVMWVWSFRRGPWLAWLTSGQLPCEGGCGMAWPPRAGQIVRASDFRLVPGQRVATEMFTSNSTTFTTTQTVVGTIVAPLEIGRTYRVRVVTRFGSTAAGANEVAAIRLCAGSMGTVGQEITSANVVVLSTSSLGWPCDFEAEFVPAAT